MSPSVFLMVISRSLRSTGLVTKSKAPRFMAVRMLTMSPQPETIPARTRHFPSPPPPPRRGRGEEKVLLQELEVDRLGDEIRRTARVGHAAPFVVAIGGHHHDRQLWPALLDLAQQSEPVHSGHVDVGQDDDQLRPNALAQHAERSLARAREMQHVEALSHFATEALAKQLRHVGLVVDDQNADAHAGVLAAAAGPTLGRRTVNSVKRPCSLSTVIVPPCCWVTMS